MSYKCKFVKRNRLHIGLLMFAICSIASAMLDNFFLALMPPQDVLETLFEAQSMLQGGKPMDALRLHVTMYLLDPAARELPVSLQRLCALMTSEQLPAARVIFDQLAGNGRTGLLLAGEKMDGVEHLRERLVALLEPANIRQFPKYRFNPHMTLRRGKVEEKRQSIDPISWDAREIVLVRSLVGQSRYEILARWPLVRRETA